MGAIAGRFPGLVVSFLLQKVMWLREMHGSPANSKELNNAGGCTYNSEAILEWDAFMVFADTGIAELALSLETKYKAANPVVMNASVALLLSAIEAGHIVVPAELVAIADNVLGMCTVEFGAGGGAGVAGVHDPIILLQILRCLKCLTPLLRLAPTKLIEAYTTLFSQMNFGEGLGAENFAYGLQGLSIFSENAVQVRKMAGTCIATISAYCSDTLVATSMMDQLYSHALKALPTLTDNSQRTSMLETLVALSEKIEDLTQRKSMYIQLLGETVSTLNSSAAQQLFANGDSILCALEYEQGRETFDACIHSLSTMVSVCRRVGFPKLPLEVWSQGMPFTLANLESVFPFTKIWEVMTCS